MKSLAINKISVLTLLWLRGVTKVAIGKHKSQRLGRYIANTVFLTWYGNYKHKLITSLVPYTRSVTIPSFMTKGLGRFHCPLKDCVKLMATVGGCVTFFQWCTRWLLACAPVNNILMLMKEIVFKLTELKKKREKKHQNRRSFIEKN